MSCSNSWTSTQTAARSRVRDARSASIGRGCAEPNDFRSRRTACFRLSRACLSPRSLHSSAASLSRERGSPGGIARTASKARSLRPETSITCPAARAWNPPSRTSSKDVIGDASASDEFTLLSRNRLLADYQSSLTNPTAKCRLGPPPAQAADARRGDRCLQRPPFAGNESAPHAQEATPGWRRSNSTDAAARFLVEAARRKARHGGEFLARGRGETASHPAGCSRAR